MCRLLFILIFVEAFVLGNSFEVHFQETYPTYHLSSDQDSLLHKRAADVPQFFDQASFSFDGLTRVASVPVPFPLDICILQLPTAKYATALHKNLAGVRHFAVYEWRPADQAYQLLVEVPTPKAVALDCLAFAGRGYVALSYNLTEPVAQAREGSPIYELSAETGIRTVQYFSGTRLRGMYLRISSQELTLLQAFDSEAKCPYFKWMGRSFQRLGSIPCSNARRLEAFGIDYTDYVAVANYADAEGRTATHSEIFKYDAKTQKFQLFQRLRSNGAVDVKYFSLPVNEVTRRHFLILGNTFGGSSSGEADTVIYVFEKGQFVPYQRLSFFALERVLPVQHSVSEKFLLLVACNKQDVKIFNLNDWRFEESKVQFTEGALSRGVARMRSYEEATQSFLVISNENMAANETNIFQPLFKQDEHANILRQQIIDWAQEQRKRLERVNIEELMQRLEVKQKKRQEKLQIAHIKKVKAKLFEDQHMKLTSNYWQALQLAKQALDILEHNTESDSFRQPAKRAADKPQAHEFEELTVDTLVVHRTVQAAHINGVDTKNPVYATVAANKVYVSETYTEPVRKHKKPLLEELSVKDLQLEGRLNGLKWEDLLELTLKRNGMDVQFIKAAAEITNLKSDAAQVNSNEVNDRPLGHLIPVDGGNFIVQQDVQFAQPVQVNRLLINQRLNHIHVDRQRFDVLLRQANYTQVIPGSKRFENVRVLEPITIAGPMSGAELRAMSPAKVTHQPLELQGDFVIEGDVTIGRLLQMKDLVDEISQKSAAEVLRRSLRLDKPLGNVNLKFLEPLTVNNTELSFLNTRDLQNLVKLNVDEVQVVEGLKVFPQNLQISEGFGEVKWLNGIDVEQLSETLLTKNGNQTISTPLELQSLEVEQVNASQISLNGFGLEDYLQVSGDQQSTSSFFVGHLEAGELSLEDLHLNGLLFGQSQSSILAHGSQNLDSWHLPPDFNGTIYAQNLWLSGNINQVSVAQLEQQLQQLAGNIKYVGDFNFGHAVNISSLSFGNSLNGIPANQFGRSWLESEGNQNFTAPQELASMESKQGVWLKGKLNNYTLDDLINRSYRLNASEHLQTVRFENPIVLQSELQVGLLNGLLVPKDVLYRNTNNGGYLTTPLGIEGNLEAANWCNVTRLNGYPLEKLAKYLNEPNLDTFLAENVKFSTAPTYNLLNGHQLDQILDHVWLDNEDVELSGVELESGNFEGLLEFQGPINGHQVEYIRRHYLSRTRGQQVKTPLSFQHDVTFAQPPTASFVELRGSAASEGISSSSSSSGNLSLNFDEFVANTLKTAGPHTISGKWTLPEASVSGNLNKVIVNQLDLATDVLRINQDNAADPITLEAPKTVNSASINRLYVTPDSQVAEVPLAKWINEAAYIYGNHTIPGITHLENVNLYNDLRVKGPVNGVLWQPDKLLLRDKEQEMQGSLMVANSLPEQQRIFTNNVENLQVDFVNGLPVNELLLNKAENRPNLHVESQLVFSQPLTVGHYELGNGIGPLDKYYKRKRDVDSNSVEDFQQLQENVDAIKNRLAKPPKVLESFALVQQLPHKVDKLQLYSSGSDDILAIRERDSDEVISYAWHPARHSFVIVSSLSTLPQQLRKQILERIPQDNQSLPTIKKSLQLSLFTFQCLGIPEVDNLVIQCLDKHNHSRNAIIMARRDTKQLLPVANDSDDTSILLRTSNTVELWKWSNGQYSLVSSLLDGQQVEHMTLMQRRAGMESGFLAIVTSAPAADIRIYRFNSDEFFQLDQVLELQDSSQVQEVRFMHLPESEDLLLCVSNQPLSIYQHRGAAGFQKILGDSVLPKAQSLDVLQLTVNKLQLLSVATAESLFLVEPQFNTL